MNHGLRRLLAVLVGMAVMAAFSLPLHAQSDGAYIKYRQKVMGSNGANIGAIGDILKNKLPLGENIAAHARNLENGAKLIASAFKKQITAGATDAKAKIWQEWAAFEKAALKLAKEAATLARVADSGDMSRIGPQVKAVGKSCGGCHKKFRKPKKESYKRK